MSTFQEMGLKKEILDAISEMGFETPTSIQDKAIPVILSSSKDIIGRAQTGTGKTGAFGLPILQKLNPKSEHVQALILCPTRELCIQITKEIQNFAKHLLNVRVIPVYGGSSMDTQVYALKQKAQIVVGTPGRTLDLINRKKLKLEELQWVVLDEADEMLSMGFKDDMDAILATTSKEKQTLLFSATMPHEIMRIVKTYMKDPIEIAAEQIQTGADNVTHHYYEVQARDRYVALKRIIDMQPEIYAIVFCRTRAETKEIADKLSSEGYNSDALHGDLSQQQREYTLGRFRSKTLQLLIATDVAARGLDVSDLTHVINYNLPDDPDTYIHRSGRTGRAHRKGISITIINSRENNRIRDLERRVGKPFERKKVPTGKEICEKQLFHLVEKVENVEVEEKQIMEFLPVIFNKLSWLDREELIKRFVSVEFNRFLAYYKNAQDINVEHRKSSDSNRGERSERSERGGRRDDRSRDDRPRERGQGERRSEKPWEDRREKREAAGSRDQGSRYERSEKKDDRKPAEFETRDRSSKPAFKSEDRKPSERPDRGPRDDWKKAERQGSGSREERAPKRDKYADKPTPAKRGEDRPKVKFAPLVINLGTVNKFNPKELLSLINQYMPDQEAQVGKIEVSYTHTIFDVDADYQDQVIGAFRKAQYRGTKIIVDQTRKKKNKEI
ncbi:MAG TPA: DEAD/DEAH box helicase [Saprospiraceae bacterium]|nr:DEAD/DEAH box helicase [Saprospiraceae bacterium]